MIVREHTYIVVDWSCVDYLQVEAPTRNYRVVHAKDSYEALCRVLQLEGVMLYARVSQFPPRRVVGGEYMAYFYSVVY
jgi:hypothetical protein|nr:MAG TPA: hypothetical protein [Caudoviricetes sp.]